MKNITLSADEHLIDAARRVAQARHTTLNAAFRDWLGDFSREKDRMQEFDALMERLNYLRFDRKYTRDELNER